MLLASGLSYGQTGTSGTDSLKFPFPNPQDQPAGSKSSPLHLNDPSDLQYDVEYDPIEQRYVIKEKLGGEEYRPADEKSFDDFWEERNAQAEKDYWKQKQLDNSKGGDSKSILDGLRVPSKGIDKLFGPGGIEIKPQGSAELIFGVTSTKTENPIIRVSSQRVTNFDFDEKIQLNVTGKIGEKLKLSTSYNTEASFDFENQMKLEYNGNEDEIIKKIELGNVSLPLNSSLIQGSQSLFGIKSELQFGKLKVTSVLSQQKSESKTIELSGGVQTKEMYINADDYDDNRHFFLAQYFKDNYNTAVANPPLVNSQVIITKAEVWVTNVGISANAEARNVIGFMDLGEFNTYDPGLIPLDALPQNGSNDLYNRIIGDPNVRKYTSASGELINSYGYSAGTHFNKIENARKLNSSEYTLHTQLGYISLNRRMEDDEVLAVAYQFTLRGSEKVYQVGEFSNDVNDVNESVFLKMLKSTQVNNTKVPLWGLMMKNVYSLGQYGIDASTLEIDIRYMNAATNNNINYMTAGGPAVKDKRWLEILEMDKLDQQMNPQPDGRYDIIDGLTIRLSNGKIYFPVLEPFGATLRSKINDPDLADSLAFDSLYAVSKFRAKNEFPNNNRFKIYAKYASKSSVINLNSFSIPKGAVSVTAGGQKLQEGVHFRVDYNMGQVTILDQSILNSNTPIRVSVESNSMFSVMSKTMFGSHLEYEINKDFHVGGTILNLTERPLTQKVNQGEEPISNTIWGVNTDYKTESQYLTKLVDMIPFIDTKEKSSIQVRGEFAQLIPGSPSAIENGDNGAVSFIDDFEAGQTGIDIRNRAAWVLASTPQGQPTEWPEGDLINDLTYGFNRAKLAWYNIDPLFSDDGSTTPDHIRNNKTIQENLYQRTVLQTEIYPQKDNAIGEPATLQTFDLAYFPGERGPYNYDTTGVGGISAGVDPSNGRLNDPISRWGGIMRKIDYVDFASQNIEFIEFWVMDPFPTDATSAGDIDAFGGSYTGGDLYVHIGNISEDVLKDGRKSFENGLPTPSDPNVTVDTTSWGVVSNKINLVNAFDNDPAARVVQDVGFDGLDFGQERTFFKPYLDWYQSQGFSPTNVFSDPSGDDYHYFRGDDLDNANANVIDRYKNFNGQEGNSPTQDNTNLDYVTTATTLPDIEDLNRDNTLSEGESYYEYKISMRQPDLTQANVGNNYLVQKVPVTVSGSKKVVNWYNFRIPVKSPDNVIGNIQDFQSIRFIRLAMKGWEDPVVLRFGSMDLVRSDWRKYEGDLYDPNNSGALADATFNVGAVNLEEDSKKSPIPYVIPPNTQRQFNLGSQARENEQAMQIQVCDLDGSDARGMYKTVGLDLLSYKRIQMDIHAETGDQIPLSDMNMSAFIRMGSDFDANYYEYEIPLSFTDASALPSGEDELRDAIWDANNRMDFNYEEVFAGLKGKRNSAVLGGVANASYTERYKNTDGTNNVYVIGSPSMANITTIMIGVRNNNPVGQTRCAEVWVNELRLSEFDKTGGWATTASVNMKLADFGNVSLGGGYSTPGWGGIDQKVSERQRETIKNFDATGNFEMGKFIPEKIGVTVPLYMSYNHIRKDQQYNPLDTDIQLDKLEDGDYKTYLNEVSPDKQTSKSINLSNVKKLPKGKKKKRIYDIENFDATYAYNENSKEDINTKTNIVKNYKGALNYNFSKKLKPVQPFKRTPFINKIEKKRLAKYTEEEKRIRADIKTARKEKGSSKKVKSLQKELKTVKEEKTAYKKKMSKIKRSPYLKLYRDFNFYYMPSQVSIKTDMTRMYSEFEVRNVSTTVKNDLKIDPTFNKNWYFNRNYKLKFDLSKAIKLDYSAQNKAFIDEPYGEIDTQEEKDSILTNIRNLGRNMMYTQSLNANYRIPINKFPWTSWVTANAKYTGKYDWLATPPSIVDSIGHSISNTNTKQINSQFNFVSLYNKIDYLKKINRKRGRKPSSRKQPKKLPNDTTNTKPQKVKKNPITGKDVLDASLRAVMMLRSASINYTENNGTFLPGFMGETQAGGMDLNNGMAPGLGFVFGSQNDIIEPGIRNGWFNQNDHLITQQVAKTNKKMTNARASIEPFNRFKIDLTATRNETTNDNFYYEINDNYHKGYREATQQRIQTLSISINTMKTAFQKKTSSNASQAYFQMLDNRLVIAQRLAAARNPNYTTNSTSFPDGYSKNHEEVLLYSFLSAYQGKNASSIKIPDLNTPNSTKGFFPSIPIPNWRLNYNGLNSLAFIKKHFKSFTLSHAYSSTLNMNGVKNDIMFDGSDVTNAEGDYITNIDYTALDVSIKESFNPLVKVDMKFKNSILAKVEVKKSRTVGMNFGGSITENSTWDVVVGAGYTIKDLVVPRVKIRGKKLKSNLDLRADVSIKNTNLTMIQIDKTITPTSGGLVTAIKVSGDYVVSKKVTARLFYDQTINTPFIQTSYPSSTSKGGISIRFTL